MGCRRDDEGDEQAPGETLPVNERGVSGITRWWIFHGSATPFMTRVVIPLCVLGMVASLIMMWVQNGYHFGR